jgi:hypothetical protein
VELRHQFVEEEDNDKKIEGVENPAEDTSGNGELPARRVEFSFKGKYRDIRINVHGFSRERDQERWPPNMH